MKLSRKLIPAFAMLLVSAIMLTTASYAWFSINNSVDVEGMSVKTTAADSVLIAESSLTDTTKAADTAFGTDLTQTVTGTLSPVSTIDGKNFFFTAGTNVDASGNAKADLYSAYEIEAFKTAYSNDAADAAGYVDYVFQIKATNASGETAKDLVVTEIMLNGAAAGLPAFRVAVFAEEFGSAFDDDAGTLVTILKPTAGAYFDDTKAVNSTNSIDDVTNFGLAAKLGSVAAHSTTYYKVVVRLWLEGEDQTCTNDTFADLTTGNFTMNLTVQLTGAGTTVLGVTTP